MTAAIELTGVTKVFDQADDRPSVVALALSDLQVEPNEFVAIVGPSGAGKSTLLSIAGLLAEPTAGEVRIDGIEVTSKNASEIRRTKLGYIFQGFRLFDHLSALENVIEGFRYDSTPARERKERAHAALEEVGMNHRSAHHPSHLSGGEQQRVAIARALAKQPTVICADEPTGNLDAATTESIVDLLRRVSAQAALVMVTHDLAVAHAADRTCVMTSEGLRDANS